MSISNHTHWPYWPLQPISNIGTVALSLSLTPEPDGWCHLLPAGHFSAVDGRPYDISGGQWFLNADGAQLLIAMALAASNDLVIDYEHQILPPIRTASPPPLPVGLRRWNDAKAPASGSNLTGTAAPSISSRTVNTATSQPFSPTTSAPALRSRCTAPPCLIAPAST